MMQSRYDGSDHEWHGKEIKGTYILKMQSRYNESNHEWHGKGIKDVLPEDAEQVRSVRSRIVWQRDKGNTF
jgi:hypothetical protein